MTRQIKPATEAQLYQLRLAIVDLKRARYGLRYAACPQTLARVRKALTSAQGAERHMIHRLQRS